MESIFSLVMKTAQQNKGRIAFTYLDDDEAAHEITFERFQADICRAVAWISKLTGGERDCKVGILAKNSYSYIVCLLGILGSGNTVVLLNVENSADEIAYEVELTELQWIIQDGVYAELEPDFAHKYIGRFVGVTDYQAYEEMQPVMQVQPDRLAVLLFTSGTTGRSKGVMLSEENLVSAADSYFDFLEKYILTGEGDAFFACFPLYHVGGLVDCISWILTGKPISINLDKRFFFRDIVAFPCTYTSVVPAELETIARYFKHGKTRCMGSIKKMIVSAAKCETILFDFFRQYGIEVHQLYGLSEFTGVGMMNFFGKKYDSIGLAEKNVEVKIVKDEICLRGKAVMLGYYQNPDATVQVLSDGWLHTGDLGRVDEEGFYYITGRKKNLIILASGENVSPEELESLVNKNEFVKEVVVREEGRKICAEIYCEEHRQQEIRSHIDTANQTLPFYKRIALVKYRTEPFPKTGSGKIKRN